MTSVSSVVITNGMCVLPPCVLLLPAAAEARERLDRLLELRDLGLQVVDALLELRDLRLGRGRAVRERLLLGGVLGVAAGHLVLERLLLLRVLGRAGAG